MWDSVTSLCLLDCESIGFSTGQWSSREVCECVDHWRWSARKLLCEPKC